MKQKLVVLGISTTGTFLMYAFFKPRDFGLCSVQCSPLIEKYQEVLIFFPLLMLFSFMMLFAHEIVFSKWLKFSFISVPIIFALAFLISQEFHYSSGTLLNTNGLVDSLFYLLIYSAYTIGSLIAIYRGYKQSKITGSLSDKRVDVRRVN